MGEIFYHLIVILQMERSMLYIVSDRWLSVATTLIHSIFFMLCLCFCADYLFIFHLYSVFVTVIIPCFVNILYMWSVCSLVYIYIVKYLSTHPYNLQRKLPDQIKCKVTLNKQSTWLYSIQNEQGSYKGTRSNKKLLFVLTYMALYC